MKIGRVVNTNLSIYENYINYFFNFGVHLYVYKPNQNLHLCNYGHYNDVFNINFNQGISLPIEEIEVFSIVNN